MVHETAGFREPAPYGALEADDEIHLADGQGNAYRMNALELGGLCRALYDLYWEQKRAPYLQLVRAWNENTGFMDVDGAKMVLTDVSETAAALRLLPEAGLQPADRAALLGFFAAADRVTVWEA